MRQQERSGMTTKTGITHAELKTKQRGIREGFRKP